MLLHWKLSMIKPRFRRRADIYAGRRGETGAACTMPKPMRNAVAFLKRKRGAFGGPHGRPLVRPLRPALA